MSGVHQEPDDFKNWPAENCVVCRKPTRTWHDPHTPLCASCLPDYELKIKKVVVIKEPDDPIALRASIGGGADVGCYCVYRGDRQKVMAVIKRVLQFMENMPANADEADSSVLGS